MTKIGLPQQNKDIAYWLLTGAILVLLMVVIGGITRLTNSGLSMVNWKPVTGFLPPLNQQEWQQTFDAYKTSPEFQKVNTNFSLADFKKIFFWEYIHRLIGRVLGFVFFFPFLYFLFTKKLQSKRLIGQLLIIFLWGGFQGFLGWYMVKSGLVDNPHVSHYRLALHLLNAFTLVAYIYWVALGLLYPKTNNTKMFHLKTPTLILFILTLLQITYGAFTAGLKAGYLYPTYPKMGNAWLPRHARDTFLSNGWQNLWQDPTLVQFTHRWIGLTVLLFVSYIFYKALKLNLTRIQKQSLYIVLALISTQFTFGILTLLFHVPVTLGVLHQLFAALFLLSIVRLAYFIK